LIEKTGKEERSFTAEDAEGAEGEEQRRIKHEGAKLENIDKIKRGIGHALLMANSHS